MGHDEEKILDATATIHYGGGTRRVEGSIPRIVETEWYDVRGNPVPPPRGTIGGEALAMLRNIVGDTSTHQTDEHGTCWHCGGRWIIPPGGPDHQGMCPWKLAKEFLDSSE